MKYLLYLLAVLPDLALSQVNYIPGRLIGTLDSFEINGAIYHPGDEIQVNYGSAVIKEIERRDFKNAVCVFARIKGPAFVPLDSNLKLYTGDKDSAKGTYTASNGITYHVGDDILLGRGSAPNGDFRYLNMGGWGAVLSYNTHAGSSQFDIGRGYSGLTVRIKRIIRYKRRGIEKVIFVVGGGNITNYNLYIEDAIATCEVRDCKQPATGNTVIQQPLSPADELMKYKKLLDAGAITQEEYDMQKKKLLSK